MTRRHDDAAADRDAVRIASEAFTVDAGRDSTIILCVGTKGSGKSEAARAIFNAWPYDRAVIDITGDARPDDPATIAVTAPFPAAMPPPPDGQTRATVWARLDPRSPTLDADHDQALALGLHPQHNKTLVLVDEYGMMATANKIPPNVSLALMSSRHYRLSLILCCPRPRRIPTMTIQQADKIFVFDTPHVDDRKALAEDTCGWERFESAYQQAMELDPVHHHSFLLWDKKNRARIIAAPLPIKNQ